MKQIKATTILCVKKDNEVSISGDGQVSFGDSILKSGAKKVRKVYNNQQSSSHGSLTESFIRSRASLSPAYMQNEVATRYNMISSIPVILPQIKKVNITA